MAASSFAAAYWSNLMQFSKNKRDLTNSKCYFVSNNTLLNLLCKVQTLCMTTVVQDSIERNTQHALVIVAKFQYARQTCGKCEITSIGHFSISNMLNRDLNLVVMAANRFSTALIFTNNRQYKG